jgi:hypothetical protein
MTTNETTTTSIEIGQKVFVPMRPGSRFGTFGTVTAIVAGMVYFTNGEQGLGGSMREFRASLRYVEPA